MKKINVIYMGTPEFSVKPLEVLIEKNNVLMVVTQPDKYVGRKRVLTPSPVKLLAQKHNIEVFQPDNIKKDYKRIIDLDVDLIVTCAYGQVVPLEVLKHPKYLSVNIHASLLPAYRGSAPINWAIINGDNKTGITLMYMDETLDTGNIIKTVETDILKTDTYKTLHDRLSILGANLLSENLDYLTTDHVESTPQDESHATYAKKIERKDELLDFSKNGIDIINQIRGLNPEPYAYTKVEEKEIKVIEAYYEEKNVTEPGIIIQIDKNNLGISCRDGIIYLTKVKPFGKNEMLIKNYLNGLKIDNIKNTKVG